MVFVPTPGAASSPRARMLSGDLARTVEEFRRRYPDTTDRDVQDALRLTAAVETKRSPALVAALVAGLALLLGAGLLLFVLGGSSIGSSELAVVVGALVLLVGIGAAVGFTRR